MLGLTKAVSQGTVKGWPSVAFSYDCRLHNKIGQSLGYFQIISVYDLFDFEPTGDFHDIYRNFYFKLLRQSGDRQKLRIKNSLTKLFDSQEGCLGKAEGWDRKGRELLYCICNRTRGGIHCQIYHCISC